MLIHLICTGVLAGVVHSWAAHLGIVRGPCESPLPTTAVITAGIGLALSALWEMIKWFGCVTITTHIYVTYRDKIGDMAAGAFGAGLLLSRISVFRDTRS